MNAPAMASIDAAPGGRAYEIDAVTLTVIQSGLEHICSEMDLVHEKASFSPVIAEAYDRANGIYHAANGDVIAQGELALPIFIGLMQSTVKEVLARRSDFEPGDIFLVNDPYLGGSHLMDVKMVRPFFYRGKLWCWLANTGHWPDTGGIVPGGFSSRATEIHQEGLRLPPVKFVRAGKIDQDILDIVLSNIRIPDERIGDIKAQIGALTIGERRLTEFLDRLGGELVAQAVAQLADRSERQMRAHIASIPDGTYDATTLNDSDGVVAEPLKVRLRITVQGSEATFDLAGSSAPCRGPMNSVWATTQASIYVAIKHIFPDVPVNAGCFRALRIPEPRGTYLYAEYPRPTAGCSAEVAQRIMEAVFVALGPAMKERIFASPAGTSGNISIGGWDPRFERPYVMYFFSGGGYGGWWENDGLANGCSTGGISKTQPIEVLEQHYPLLFDWYALREGSGGAGRHRGGFGVDYQLRLLAGTGTASFLMDHGLSGPPGLDGGLPGAPNRIEICTGGAVSTPEHVSKGDGYELAIGDTIRIRTPGGGGYGPARERTAARRERDLRRGYYSTEEDRALFGDGDGS